VIAALILAAQTMVTGAPPITEARPATDWSCDFNDANGARFQLRGAFAEAPVGSDPNAGFATVIEGDGPAPLAGKMQVKAFDSHPDLRSYQVSAYAKDGSSYVMSFGFVPGDGFGLATVTRYVPDAVTKRGTLFAYATGNCRATFHPVGVPAK
jgi:hypothetical protein